jgi:hypothetical protein
MYKNSLLRRREKQKKLKFLKIVSIHIKDEVYADSDMGAEMVRACEESGFDSREYLTD